MMIWMEKIITDKVLHYLKVDSILHQLAHLHQMGDWPVVLNQILLILLV